MYGERENLRRLGEGRRFGFSCGGLGNGAERVGVYFAMSERSAYEMLYLSERMCATSSLLALAHLREFRVLGLGIKMRIHQRIITLEQSLFRQS